jgi:flagellar biosynthesis anti-sigma factor FlgM
VPILQEGRSADVDIRPTIPEMLMRIDDKGLPQGLQPLGGTERTEAEVRAGKTAQRGQSGVDTVQLSPDAHLIHRAIAAVGDGPAVRADRVEAVRAKLEAGQLGQDLGRLADRLIDDILERG